MDTAYPPPSVVVVEEPLRVKSNDDEVSAKAAREPIRSITGPIGMMLVGSFEGFQRAVRMSVDGDGGMAIHGFYGTMVWSFSMGTQP
jgi:hypothetical protein